jgi:sec-independent protein translocase protein TatB
MLAGPDLLVVLGIAFVVIGPKRLPELAKTIGKALAEFKKTTEEIKDSIGIKELGGIRSSLTGIDLLTDLAERVSTSMAPKEETSQATGPVENSFSLPVKFTTPVSNDEISEKGKSEKLDEVKELKPAKEVLS